MRVHAKHIHLRTHSQPTTLLSLAKEIGVPFFETSAKGNTNVEQAFQRVAVDAKNRLESLERPSESSFIMTDNRPRRGGCC